VSFIYEKEKQLVDRLVSDMLLRWYRATTSETGSRISKMGAKIVAGRHPDDALEVELLCGAQLHLSIDSLFRVYHPASVSGPFVFMNATQNGNVWRGEYVTTPEQLKAYLAQFDRTIKGGAK
jgi:hypothetical protein